MFPLIYLSHYFLVLHTSCLGIGMLIYPCQTAGHHSLHARRSLMRYAPLDRRSSENTASSGAHNNLTTALFLKEILFWQDEIDIVVGRQSVLPYYGLLSSITVEVKPLGSIFFAKTVDHPV